MSLCRGNKREIVSLTVGLPNGTPLLRANECACQDESGQWIENKSDLMRYGKLVGDSPRNHRCEKRKNGRRNKADPAVL